jgi:RHS repeat-associated protein
VLVYDDENRLTQWFFYQNGAAQPGPGDKRTDFAYDGFGRLRKRVEFNWAQQTNPPPEELLVVQAESQLPADDPMTWMASAEVRYLYDGFRVIQERDSNNIPTVSYTRGRDLSGSLQGAGGIGGLLARSHIYGSYSGNWSGHNYYHADGNGNISKMVSPGHVVAASYRYDPFGNLVSKSGPLADANVYRFSSKENHVNSGLYYYGYRFYSPNLQRWINRDPIAERGGMNLYGFVGNRPQNVVDPNGEFAWIPLMIVGFVWGAVMAEEPANAPVIGEATFCKLSAGQHLEAGVGGAIVNLGLGGIGVLVDGPRPGLTTPVALESTPEFMPTIKTPVLPKCNATFGPYHRLNDPAALIEKIGASGELWGGPPRNVAASDIPAVKAHPGPLPPGAFGFEFVTPVPPNSGQPGLFTGYMWSGPGPNIGRPGVTVVPYEWAQIPVTVTKINLPPATPIAPAPSN